jgi:hypothetical protein
VTNLDNFSTTSDFADWASGGLVDANNAFATPGVVNAFSQTDVTEMNALGYSISPTAVASVATSAAAASASPTSAADSVATLTTTQVAAMTAQQIAALAADQVQALSLSDINLLNTGQVAALTTSQVQMLTTTQVGTFSPIQVQALNQSDLSTLVNGLVQVMGSFNTQGGVANTLNNLNVASPTQTGALVASVSGMVNVLNQFNANGHPGVQGTQQLTAVGQIVQVLGTTNSNSNGILASTS